MRTMLFAAIAAGSLLGDNAVAQEDHALFNDIRVVVDLSAVTPTGDRFPIPSPIPVGEMVQLATFEIFDLEGNSIGLWPLPVHKPVGLLAEVTK